MRIRLFGVGREALTQEDVERTLRIGEADAAVESEHLEFKADLPQKREGRSKLARNVAAFANGAGGVVICGLADDGADRAAELRPVVLGVEVENLRRALNQLLSPPAVFVFRELPHEPGAERGLLLIEVPSSDQAPHAVHEGDRPEFLVRRGRECLALREPEIERAFRLRFAARADVEERLEWARRLAVGGSKAPGSGWRHAPSVRNAGPTTRRPTACAGSATSRAEGRSAGRTSGHSSVAPTSSRELDVCIASRTPFARTIRAASLTTGRSSRESASPRSRC